MCEAVSSAETPTAAAAPQTNRPAMMPAPVATASRRPFVSAERSTRALSSPGVSVRASATSANVAIAVPSVTRPSSWTADAGRQTGPVLPPPGTPGTDLPVRSALPGLADALSARGSAVLVAPPGTGKTTLLPLTLAGTLPGRIVVAEPRRAAARAAARRMAALLGESVGGRVGYSVRGESRRSAATRIEVVTTGLLVRRLQADPELSGVDAVVLDECHERHLDTDLALAFCLDVRADLRPDLQLLAMSATAQAQRLAALLGRDDDPAPVVEATGALFDVDVRWAPPTGPVDPPHGTRVDPRLLSHVAATV